MVNFSATMAARAPALEADIAREHFLDYTKLKLIVERGLAGEPCWEAEFCTAYAAIVAKQLAART